MFNSIGWGEVAVLVILAVFIFGPERLPQMAAEAGRMLRTLRQMANSARSDLQSELGPELGDLDLASLNPKAFVRKHLFDDEEPAEVSVPSARRPPVARPLAEGERAPYDADAT